MLFKAFPLKSEKKTQKYQKLALSFHIVANILVDEKDIKQKQAYKMRKWKSWAVNSEPSF